MKWSIHLIGLFLYAFLICSMSTAAEERSMIDIKETTKRLHDHLEALTVTIGERSVLTPQNLKRTAEYIETFYQDIGVSVHREPYSYRNYSVANIVSEISFGDNPAKRFILGAHYDSVAGTVGADDNASAIAVQLETARQLNVLKDEQPALSLAVTFVSFALEEPPTYGTRHMGSRVYALKARKEKEQIDGMICLEMVGYTCHQPGCQSYPFPLMFFGYPKQGNYVGIVGNLSSGSLTQSLFRNFRKNPKLPVIKLTVPLGGWLLPSVRLSDHASFWDKGYKAVMITDTAFFRNPHYHMPSDTMDKLDFGFMAELVESLVIFFTSHKR
jgi:Zn-dependent M28 family amino/carboxypeptidase